MPSSLLQPVSVAPILVTLRISWLQGFMDSKSNLEVIHKTVDEVHYYHLKCQQFCSKGLLFERLSIKISHWLSQNCILHFFCPKHICFRVRVQAHIHRFLWATRYKKVYDAEIAFYFLRFWTTQHQIKMVLKYQATKYFIYYTVSRCEFLKSFNSKVAIPHTLIWAAQDKGVCAHVPVRGLKAVFVHPEQWGMWHVNTTHNKNSKIKLPLISLWPTLFLLILSHNINNKNLCCKIPQFKKCKLSSQRAQVLTQTPSNTLTTNSPHSFPLTPSSIGSMLYA